MHYIWAHLLKLYWDCGPVALSVVLSVILIRALNAGPCNSHWISSPSFLPVKTVVWGRGAEETAWVMFYSEYWLIWEMHVTKDWESHPRLGHFDTALESSEQQSEWQHVPVITGKVQHFHECPHCFMLHPKLCPFYLVSYDICCEVALRSSSTANIFNPFSRESCNRKLGDNH